jgi:hypothetical protein
MERYDEDAGLAPKKEYQGYDGVVDGWCTHLSTIYQCLAKD